MSLRPSILVAFLVATFLVPALAPAKEIALEEFVLEEGSFEETADHIPWSGIWWPQADGELSTGWNGTRSFRYDATAKKYVPVDGVADGDASPLVKYDRFVARRWGQDPGSALVELHGDEARDFSHHVYGEEKERLDREGVNYGWWGHCNGWAAAAVMEKEPLTSIDREGIRFEVADLKGLLTEVYFGVRSDFTGRRYNKPAAKLADGETRAKALLEALKSGSPRPVADYIDWYEKTWSTTMSDSAKKNAKPESFRSTLEWYLDWYEERFTDAYEDVYADTFHKILVSVIGRQGRAVVFDVSADEQVWNFPAYRYTTTITRDGSIAIDRAERKKYRVRTVVLYAHDGVSESILGVVPLEKSYTYELYTDEAGKIVGGKWTGSSVDNHPDFAWLPTFNPAGADESENPKTEYGKVLALLAGDSAVTAEDRLTLVVTDRAGAEVSSTQRANADDTTTWENPVPVGASAIVRATGTSTRNATRVVLYRQPVRTASGRIEATREARAELAELTAAGDWKALVQFPTPGKTFLVAHAFAADGSLLSADEITLDVAAPTPVPAADDPFEENDSKAQAATVQAGTHPDLAANDDDWYRIDVAQGQDLEVRIEFQHARGDLDMKLENASARSIQSSTSTSDVETVGGRGLAAGTYYVRVYGYRGAKAPYRMIVTLSGPAAPEPPATDDRFEENDTRPAAAAIARGSYPGLRGRDEDWYRLQVSAGQKIRVRITFRHADGDLDLYLHGAGSTPLARSWSVTDDESIEYTATATGTLDVQVAGYDGATNDYDLVIE